MSKPTNRNSMTNSTWTICKTLLFALPFTIWISLSSQSYAQGIRNQSTVQPALSSANGESFGTSRISRSPASTSSSSNDPNDQFTNAVQQIADQNDAMGFLLEGPNAWTSREGLSSSLQILLLLTVLSLAPAVLLMTTCYVRIIVVFGLLKQAMGTPQLPPGQVITSIALFMTMFVMAPVWSRVYNEAIVPYTAEGSQMNLSEAWEAGSAPIREFMQRQIRMAKNHDDVHLFYSYYRPSSPPPTSFDDVPLQVLLPAYMLSELKTAFLMGFQIFLPFLILDMVVASVTISMGMMMLPPSMISMPFKLLLFVLLDGWRLVVQMLLESFGTYAST